jgi:hypothetical protein
MFTPLDVDEKLYMAAYYFFITLYKIFEVNQKDYKNKDMFFILIGQGFLLLAYIAANKLNLVNIKLMITISSVVFTTLILIYIYNINIKSIRLWEKNITKPSVENLERSKVIFTTIMSIVGSVLVIILLLTGVVSRAYVEINWADTLLGKFIRWFFKDDVVSDVHLDKMQKSGEQAAKPLEGDGWLFWKILEQICWVLLFAFLIYVAVRFVKYIINNIDKFRRSGNKIYKEQKEDVFNMKEWGENIKDSLSVRKNSILNYFNSSTNSKIRKKYYKFIKDSKCDINQSNTAMEIENLVEDKFKKDAKEITKTYEKARYGSNECSQEELKNLEVSIKNFKR